MPRWCEAKFDAKPDTLRSCKKKKTIRRRSPAPFTTVSQDLQKCLTNPSKHRRKRQADCWNLYFQLSSARCVVKTASNSRKSETTKPKLVDHSWVRGDNILTLDGVQESITRQKKQHSILLFVSFCKHGERNMLYFSLLQPWLLNQVKYNFRCELNENSPDHANFSMNTEQHTYDHRTVRFSWIIVPQK
jgi:hypothetical protein